MRAALLVLCLAVTGCQSSAPPPAISAQSEVPFNPAEAAFIKKSGKAVIKGEAFQRSPTGSVIHAAGEVVRLIPQSSYAKDRFAKLYGDEKFIPARSIPKVEADPAYIALTRTTKVDDRGKFSFDHVPPGAYFVTTQVSWNDKAAPTTLAAAIVASMHPEGGAMYETVTVSSKDDEDTPVEVIVSGK